MENQTINQNNKSEMMDIPVWYFLPIMGTVPTLGLPSNALVIRLLLGKPGICSTSEIFILNLALFDMLFCVMFIAEFIRFMCTHTVEAANFLALGLIHAGGPMLLCILSLDSYVAVCHPLVFLRLKDPKLRLWLCSVVSAVTLICCVLVKLSPVYKGVVTLGLLSSAIVTISTCNILILKSLRHSGPNRKVMHPVKKRAFKTVLTALVLVNVHYLTPLIEYLIRHLGTGNSNPFSLPTCLSYLTLSMGSFVQPLCYLVRTKQLPKISRHCGSAAETKTVAAD